MGDKTGLNRQPLGPQPSALPIELLPPYVGKVGLEPTLNAVSERGFTS